MEKQETNAELSCENLVKGGYLKTRWRLLFFKALTAPGLLESLQLSKPCARRLVG
jgi:hypothetical protein